MFKSPINILIVFNSQDLRRKIKQIYFPIFNNHHYSQIATCSVFAYQTILYNYFIVLAIIQNICYCILLHTSTVGNTSLIQKQNSLLSILPLFNLYNLMFHNQSSNTEAEPNIGRWTQQEHKLFLKGIEKYGKDWKKISQMIGTRSCPQIRSHAQKYFRSSKTGKMDVEYIPNLRVYKQTMLKAQKEVAKIQNIKRMNFAFELDGMISLVPKSVFLSRIWSPQILKCNFYQCFVQFPEKTGDSKCKYEHFKPLVSYEISE